MQVIICDAETRSALSALRALVGQGAVVVAGSYKNTAISFYSRWCTEKQCYPNPATKRSAFVAWVAAYLRDHPDTLCMSFTDVTTDALLQGVEEGHIPRTAVIGPAWDNYQRATNKRTLARIATELSIPTGEEVVPTHTTGFAVPVVNDAYPLIIKPVRSVSWNGECAYKDTARVVHTPTELRVAYEHFCAHANGEPLIQKMITGDEFGVSLLADKGKVCALFAHKRLRSISVYGGVSTLRESVELTDEMRTIAERIAKQFAWSGVMMIELKRNNATGKLTLIEVNARFWGSLFLAIQAGVNFPYLLYQHALGNLAVTPTPPYRVGVRARHFVTDLSYFYALKWKALTPRNIIKFFTFYQKDLYFDVWSFRDPIPWFVELFQFIKKKL